MLPANATMANAIWHYLATPDQDTTDDTPLFATQTGSPLDRQRLHHLLDRSGHCAKVPGVYPHKFRHTSAINFLRNDADIYSLDVSRLFICC